jgi:peptide/nickel transport system ATP-binding protein
MTDAVLDVVDLSVRFYTDTGIVPAVNGISFTLSRGETLALVGESGSGKSVTSLAIMRLTPPPPICEVHGRATLAGTGELLSLPEPMMRDVRGSRIAMVFQEPMTSLNPVLPIGEQIAEPLRYHRGSNRATALQEATRLLELVGIPEPAKRLASYPHQLSGGMRQRAMIAIALACDPDVLIADEPTTALDVTVQAQILELLKSLQARTGMAMLFITHNLGVVAEMADRVMVMYAGRVVEQAPSRTLFHAPLMPYTRGLLRSVPKLSPLEELGAPLAAIPGNVPNPAELPNGCAFAPRCEHVRPELCETALPALDPANAGHLVRCVRWRELCGSGVGDRGVGPAAAPMELASARSADPILAVCSLRLYFPLPRRLPLVSSETVKAVDDVSFSVLPGEVLGLVGESGSGKTTVGRTVLRLLEATDGSIRFRGRDTTHLSRRALRPIRPDMQLVFQDPFASLNPRMTIGRIVAAPLLIHRPQLLGEERREMVASTLRMVGLSPEFASRYPHEFSGGQRQRVGIARALILRPGFLVADEPVSALDVSIQAQVVNLLRELRAELGLSILFIAHDLAVVGHISDRVAVMYLGRIVELAPTRALFRTPRHPYTEALLSAAPEPDPDRRRQRIVLAGDPPSAINPPVGCRFHTRCRYAEPACAEAVPALREVSAGHYSACRRPELVLEGAG